MSFPSLSPHPDLRPQSIDLQGELPYYISDVDLDLPPHSADAHAVPIFEPFSHPTDYSHVQLSNMTADIAHTQPMPLQTHGRDAGGPFNMDPFIDATKKVGPTSFGVLKIRNIPYDVTRKEIVHFLGRSTDIIEDHSLGCAVHIIMERPTSKTMDCFVEFRTDNAVHDQIRRHEDLVQSGRHPKLGSRHVQVEGSDQNALLAEIFPRAKSIVWEEGTPVVTTNDDPYSTGFKGFFTKEEMVGLVRHAECPQRSPFSINCLQRTFECMISTLYKFPWYAAELYTLTDRNLLFSTYMKQMYVLVDKVDSNDTKGLDQNLLRDFIFAGMNCPGFGERQKHELVTAAGLWGGGIEISPLGCFWPFDLICRKDEAKDDETVKFFLDLIERGVEVYGNRMPFKERFIIKPRLPPTATPANPYFFNNTGFQFNEDSQSLDYGTAMCVEMKLMKELLSAGYASLKQHHEYSPEAGFANSQRQLVESLLLLNWQHEKVIEGGSEDERLPRAAITPPQSPKGTIAALSDLTSQINLTPTGKTPKPIDPTSKPFEPRRRLSEPRHVSSVIGDSPAYSPFRRRTSSTLSLPFSDDSPATCNPRARADYITPTKMKRGARFSVDHTIHEEEAENLSMTINSADLQKTD